jgi:mRNA-degrading endonuclease RelE of RelBE toxin-antitoxin system
MYRIIATSSFKKSFEILPKKIQMTTTKLIELLAIDYRDPRLHTKKLHGNRIEYSFRIHREYRGIFCFENGNIILLLMIAHRKDIYK